MKNWIKQLLIGLGIAGLLVSLTACQHGAPEERQAKMLEKVSEKLELTDAQKPYAENLMAAFSNMRKEMRDQREENQSKMRALITSDSLDKAEVNRLFSARENVFKANQEAIVDALAAFHDVLTPEQRQKAEKMLSRFEKKANKRFKKCGGPKGKDHDHGPGHDD